MTVGAVPPRGSSGTGGSGPSVLAGAAGLVADAIESALAAGLEGLRSPTPRRPPTPRPRLRRVPGRPRASPVRHGRFPRRRRRPSGSRRPARRPAPRRHGDRPRRVGRGARIANGTLERLDLNAIIDRVNVGRVIAKVDIEAVLSRVDLDALLAKVDVDRLVQRLDVGALAKEAMDGIDLGEVIRESTASIGSDTVNAVRDQAMRADGIVARVVDRALGRPTGTG